MLTRSLSAGKQVSMSPSLVSLLHSRLLFYGFLLFIILVLVLLSLYVYFYAALHLNMAFCLLEKLNNKNSGTELMRTGFLPKACCLQLDLDQMTHTPLN